MGFYPGFAPQSKLMAVRLNGFPKLFIGLSVCVCTWLFVRVALRFPGDLS